MKKTRLTLIFILMLLCVGLAFSLTSCEYDEHIHTPNSAVREKEVSSTCTAVGSYDEVVYCSVCDAELSREEKEIAKLPHTEVTDVAKAPSCTETGLTEGKHCSVCNEVLIAQETIDANGHTDENTDYICDVCDFFLCFEHKEEIIPAVSATCTETGLSEGKKCSVCGDILLEQEVVNALGHVKVVDEAVEPTCTETGLTEGEHCSVCDRVLILQEKVGAKGHVDENEDYVCDVCEAELCTEHEEETIPAVSATCTESGLTEGKKCSVCGDILIAQETVKANGHTEVTDEAVAPTCTETGLTEGKHCEVCSEVLVAQETVKANGHSYIEKNTDSKYFATAADCENATTYFYSCACGAKGATTFTHGEPNGHNYTEKNINSKYLDKAADCENAATYFYSCACGHKGTDTFAHGESNGHSFVFEKADIAYQHTPATEYSAAIYYKSCSCGKASATETFTYGDMLPGYLTYKLSTDSSYYIVTGYVGAQTEISVPHLHDGLPVFVIMEGAFRDNTYIQSITMPNSIQVIGSYAFANCTSLESIIIPTSVTDISPYTFSGCTALETITLHSGIEVLGTYAFEKCSALKSITLNEGLKTISDNAFDYCTALESILIPDTVTTLGNMAFRHAESLGTVKFSKALKSIGNSTFQYCVKLESVELHENIDILGNSTFSYCDGLKSIRILGNLTTIGKATFYECRSLEAIYYASSAPGNCGDSNYIFYNAGINGEGITLTIAKDAVIPEGFFMPYVEDNMPKITKIVIDEGTTKVNSALNYNKLPYLTEIVYPSTVTEPCYGAFNNSLWWDNQNFGEVFINGIFYGYKCHCYMAAPEEPVTENYVGSQCTVDGGYDTVIYCKICKDELKRTATVIPQTGHSPKTAIEENRIEATCTEDGHYENVIYCSTCNDELSRDMVVIPLSHKFKNDICSVCGSLKSSSGLFFALNPNGKEYTLIGVYDDFDTSNLVIDTYNNLPVTIISDYAFAECSKITSVTIGNNVKNIGRSAFAYNSNLISVTMGDGITSVGESAFLYCQNLTRVYITDISNWCNISFASALSNPLYNAENLYLNGTLVTECVIPDSVTSIGDYVFYCCKSLTGITIPNGAASIGDYAFSGCSNLASVDIPCSVSLIGDHAFSGCSNLASLDIPCSVSRITGSVFNNCNNLTTITVDENNAYYKSVNGNLYTKNGKVLIRYVIDKRNSEFTIPDSVETIGDYAFSYCASLTSVVIPNSVTSIGDVAFYNCANLASVTIGNSVTSIGENAFCRCTSLISMTIGNSVASIGENAFYGCTSLTSVIIPDSVTSIGDYAFYKCTSLTSVKIPDSITSINYHTFAGCTNLTSVTISDSVEYIGSYAFFDCSNLINIYYKGTQTQWNTIVKMSSWNYYGESYTPIPYTITYNYSGN